MRALGCLALHVIVSSLLLPSIALASVTEPSGLTVPILQANSLDYFAPDRYNENTLGHQTLLDTWEGVGVINAYSDAMIAPSTFVPSAKLKVSLILSGGSCQVDFGWYCADDAVGSEVIHPLVTVQDIIRYHDIDLKTLTGAPVTPN